MESLFNQRNRRCLLWLAPIAAIGFAVALFTVDRFERATDELDETSPVALQETQLQDELYGFFQVPLKGIRFVSPYGRSTKPFNHSIEVEDQLRAFREAARQADTQTISEESDAIFESGLILVNDHIQIQLLASVHEEDPEDLFLSGLDSGTPKQQEDVAGDPQTAVRVPGMGQWIMAAVPEGKLRAHRGGPRRTTSSPGRH